MVSQLVCEGVKWGQDGRGAKLSKMRGGNMFRTAFPRLKIPHEAKNTTYSSIKMG
jgi:hypothetical protein